MKRQPHQIIRLITFLVLISLLWPPLGLAPARAAAPDLPAVRILHSDGNGVTLELDAPSFDAALQAAEDGSFAEDALPGVSLALSNEAGKPQVPVVTVLLGVPAQGEVQVSLSGDAAQSLALSTPLATAPRPAPLDWEAEAGEWMKDPLAAAAEDASPYPALAAEIVQDAWLREQRVVLLRLSPFQALPDQKSLLWRPHMQVMVTFTGGAGEASFESGASALPGSAQDALLEGALLNYEQALAWRTQPVLSDLHETSISGPRLKIGVEQDGMYKITHQDLVDAGMDPAGIDPRRLRMTSQGLEIAIYVAGESDGVFDTGDYILFYGVAFQGERMATWYADENQHWMSYLRHYPDGSKQNWQPQFNATVMEKYTDRNIYWLSVAGAAGQLRMGTVNGAPGSATTPSSYRATAHAETSLIRWDAHFTGEDNWFWDYFYDANVHAYSTNLSALAAQPFTAIVRGELVSFNYNDSMNPDHHVLINLNNRTTPIDDATWDGRSRYAFEAQVPGTDLLSGANALKLQIVLDAAPNPQVLLDWFEIEYARQFLAVDNWLSFTGEAGTWRYVTDGFSSADITVYEITDASQPVRVLNPAVTPSGGAYQASFQVSHGAGAGYALVAETALKTPAALSYYTPPELRSDDNGADYIIIAHPDFLSGAQDLADYRADQGLRTLVVSIEDVYNEFNEGILHPMAIKNFLEYTFAHWVAPLPAYVVLVGDGHWDLKHYISSSAVLMPPYLAWVDPWMGEADSSNLLAAIVGDDVMPDVLIGRIPVKTPAQMADVVDKIIAFEGSPRADWQRNHLFVADNTPDSAGDFPASANSIIDTYIAADFSATKVYMDDYADTGNCGIPPYDGGPSCPNVNAAIAAALNGQGMQFVNFFGHAAHRNWAHERIWYYRPASPYYNDFDTLTNSSQLPIVLSLTCLDGHWYHPLLEPSIAELFLAKPQAGAAATFSPTGLGIASGHDRLVGGFYQAVYGQGVWELGAATLAARLALFSVNAHSDLINTYTIFGDPALHLLSPYGLEASADRLAQSGLEGTSVEYQLTITNTGSIADTFVVAINGNQWTTTTPESQVALAAGAQAQVPVTVQIPLGVFGGQVDQASVSVTSIGDIEATATFTLSTTAKIYGVDLAPSQAWRTVLPGSSVEYQLTLTNTGDVADTFLLTAEEDQWPLTIEPATSFDLDPGEQAFVTVSLSVPADTPDKTLDIAVISAASQSAPNRKAISTLQTLARTYGVDVSPSIQYRAGNAGDEVAFAMRITNIGGYTDEIDLSAASALDWGLVPLPASVGPLEPGEVAVIPLTVSIPAAIQPGLVDSIVFEARSVGDVGKLDTGTAYLTANGYGVALNAAPDTLSALPGRVVTYTVTLNNLGNTADIFDVEITGALWETQINHTSMQIYPFGSTPLQVLVTIPLDAHPWEQDLALVTAVSQGDALQVAQITLRTHPQAGGYLPMVLRR
ncbi:MAG: hypothetical protein JW726_00185 [Anaerolineales bacterium]|nr:hypothetical protein [Anaerolineales bacterium]